MNAFFFWLFSIGMIVCGLTVVLNRNAVASALAFAFTIVFMSGLFVMLSAFFLAAVQILVTAGAVMVLFLFIIMLLDLSLMEHLPRQKVWMGCALVLGLGLLYIVALTLRATPLGFATESSLNTPGEASIAAARATMTMGGEAPTQSEWDKEDDTHRIGYLLFTTHVDPFQTSYVAPFEITSLLILVATIGVIVLCKENEPRRPGPREEINREAPPIEPGKKTTLTR